MCNACGFLCCASDVDRQCGCDCAGYAGCWERCDDCGDVTQFGDPCMCDEDDDYPAETP